MEKGKVVIGSIKNYNAAHFLSIEFEYKYEMYCFPVKCEKLGHKPCALNLCYA